MAGRLGSDDLVNTIVIAHPGNLTPAQIRAIKVNLPRMLCPSRDLTYMSPQVPASWVLAEGKNITFFFRSALHHLLHIADDQLFKDKDVKTAEGIFKEQEEKPDHVDYEFRVYQGKFLLVIRARFVQLNPNGS